MIEDVLRTARRTVLVVLGLAVIAAVVAASGIEAQTAGPGHSWEFVVNSGTVVPTGAQRDAIKRAGLTAAQLTYVVRPEFAVTTTIGWARSRDIATIGDPRLDVFTYDAGAEVRAPRLFAGKTLSFSPFAGAGAGGRSYNYRSLDVDATHNVAGYASAGGELGYRRARVRVDVRDYITGFRPLAGSGAGDTRNDIAVMVGVRLASR